MLKSISLLLIFIILGNQRKVNGHLLQLYGIFLFNLTGEAGIGQSCRHNGSVLLMFHFRTSTVRYFDFSL